MIDSELSDTGYERVCEETLESLTDRFEEIAEDYSEEMDVNYAVRNLLP